MTKKDTARFLRLMNSMNNSIATREAEEFAPQHVGMDLTRVQRDAERRERLGQLRARPHSRRVTPVRKVFGFTDS